MKIFFVIRNSVKFGLFILFSILPIIGSSQCISGNCINGTGTYIYPSGGKYTGEWKDDKRHGQGTHNYSNGDKYVGEWKDDKHHGQGKKIWSDGSKYEGQWYNGIPKDNTNQGQPHKSTSLGLVCRIQEKCQNCSGTGVKKSGGPGLAFVVKECYKCKGVSNDILYLKPCSKCKNTRKISELDLVEGEPRKTTSCSICEGEGQISLYQLEVADEDFPRIHSNGDGMNWYEATDACEAIGDGWRLPTPSEFEAMYYKLHQKGKGNFKNRYSYWSSKEYDSDHAYNFSFENNKVHNYGSKLLTPDGYQNRKYVRAVRTKK